MKMGKRKFIWGIVFFLVLLQCPMLKVNAAEKTIYDSPYAAFSPDGQAWTFREALCTGNTAGEPDYWYVYGETIDTEIVSGLRSPEEGEHYYTWNRNGVIPVGRWEVRHTYAQCVHPEIYGEYHGIDYRSQRCLASYYSGWNAYCADCGQPVTPALIYGSKKAVSSVWYIDTGLDYYYCCPSCRHLEQGITIEHKCRAISCNMYRVVYDGNSAYMDKKIRGYMPDSCHMYNNATCYEGNEIVPDTRLNLNGYDLDGYTFVGWNTKPDGSGSFYEDGAEILNLSAENYDETTGKGIVILYAQWTDLQFEVQEVYYRDHALNDWRTAGSIYGAVKAESGKGDNAYATPSDERAVLHATGAVDLRVYPNNNSEKLFRIWMSDEMEVGVLNAAYGSMKAAENSEAVAQTVWKKVVDSTAGFVTGDDCDSHVMTAVPARDKAAPDRISDIAFDVNNGGAVISWQEPKGNSSVVSFFCESYYRRDDSVEKILTTNILSAKIDSAIAGYYYICNEDAGDAEDYLREKVRAVGFSNAYAEEEAYTYEDRNAALFSNEIGFTKDYRLDAEDVGNRGNRMYDPNASYIHIAAVDVAGNISDTVLVRSCGVENLWGPETDTLFLSSVVSGVDRGNILPVGRERTWYVRADGQTPFLLSYESRLRGPAREDYQINYQILDSRAENGMTQRYSVELPLTVPVASGGVLDSREFIRKSLGESILEEGAYVEASRDDRATTVSFGGAFVLSEKWNGQEIVVTPVAGADHKDGTMYSDWAQDCLHSLTLIADGEGPVVSGLDALEDRCVIDRTAEEIELKISAEDNLSGVEEFYVKVTNTDNYSERDFAAENGFITLNITEDDPLFAGDFTVTVYARDGVGNVTQQSRQVTEFALETGIERILEPHAPAFKGGESGILTVITYGYADRVEIVFPEEMTALRPDLNQTIDYRDQRLYRQESRVQFMVPLYTPGGLSYEVTVRAYKEGRKLEEHPALSTMEIEGNVLDEMRTRLR